MAGNAPAIALACGLPPRQTDPGEADEGSDFGNARRAPVCDESERIARMSQEKKLQPRTSSKAAETAVDCPRERQPSRSSERVPPRAGAQAAAESVWDSPDRVEIEAADFAARRIAEEGAAWSSAIAEAQALFGRAPAAESLSHALRRRFALFSPDSHKRILRQKREAAALVMARCSDFGVTLRLIGHVLEGSATAHSAVELVVVSLASGEALDDKSVSLALLNAGFDPELFETPYPTAYARRLSGGSRRAGRRRLATLLIHATDEPILIRIPLVPAPLPKAVCPDDYQSEAEAAGAADLEALQRLLAQTPYDADRSETGGECVPKGLPLSHLREAR